MKNRKFIPSIII